MRTLKNILITVLFALASNMTASAYDFVSGGIYYNIISSKDKTVEVTRPNNTNEYSGEITIPSSVVNNGVNYTVTQIGNSAFDGCGNMTKIDLPKTLVKICGYSFYRTGLTTITIPGSVKEIEGNPFYWSSKMTDIKVESSNTYFTTVDGILYSKDMSTLVAYPLGKEISELTIPEPVSIIGSSAFEGCKKLTNICLPNTLKKIASNAFFNVSNLKCITLPESLTDIESQAFNYTGFPSIIIPKSVTFISNSAFARCSSLQEIIVDAANPNYCSEDGILFNKNKTTLMNFPPQKGPKYTTPTSVTELGDYAFYYCSNLSEITITKNVSQMSGRNLFYNTNFKKFTIYCETAPDIKNNFSFIPDCDLYIPKNSYSSYTTKDPWYNFKSINPIEGGEFELTDYIVAFKSLKAETSNFENGEKAKFFLTIKNNGKNFNEIKLRVGCTNKSIEYMTIKESFSFGEEKTIEFCIDLPNKNITDCSIVVSLEEVDGSEYEENVVVSAKVNIFSKLYDRNVVIEETTGTWCGWCVRGIVAMEDLKKNYPETAIGIAVHGDDEMAISNYYTSGSYPSCNVDRYLKDQHVDETFKDYYEAERARRTYADFTMDGLLKDGKVHISSSFCFDFSKNNSDFRMVYVLKEDGVTGYAQTNYYAGGGNGPMGGFEDKPSTIKDHVFNDVARLIYPNYYGQRNLPVNINAGERYEHSAEIDLPTSIQDFNKLTLVGMLLDGSTGEIVQAHQLPLPIYPYINISGKTDVLPNEKMELSLSLDNSIALRGFQFDIIVPEGLDATITKTSAKTDHTLTVEKIGNNTYRILSYSNTNSEYPANFGEFAKISIAIPSDYKLGNYNITSDNIYLSDVNNEIVATGNFKHDFNISENRATLVESIELNYKSYELLVSEMLQLEAYIKPEDADNKDVSWSSSNEDVAIVNNSGKVVALDLGKATITATAKDGSGVVATCEITVSKVSVESITLNKTEISMHIGDNETLSATILPDNSEDKTVTWKSSDNNIATISSDGVVTAVAIGECEITATCSSKTATCKVCVVPILVEKIELNHTAYSLNQNDILQLVATILPENADNKEVSWSSSNEDVVYVSKTGKAVFMGFGDAVVTCKALDGSGVFATCTFSNVDGIISISTDEIDVEIYTIDGKKVQNAGNGTYIIRGKDGKAKKVVVK